MHDKIVGVVGTAFTAVATAGTTNEVLETIYLIITILGALLTFLIMPVLNKIKEAKKDGKITPDEAIDIADTAVKGGEKVVEEITKGEKKDV